MMRNKEINQLIDNAWQISFLPFLTKRSIEPPPATDYLDSFTILNSYFSEHSPSCNIVNDYSPLYGTLKLSIISEWAYRNISAYHKDEVTIADLCKNAFTPYTKEHNRLLNKIIKTSPKLNRPSANYALLSKLYSEYNDISFSTKLNNIFSYNETCNLIIHWNNIQKLFSCQTGINFPDAINELINILYADLSDVSNSKTKLGCIAPQFIIHQFNNELLDAYFLLELVYLLFAIQKDIELTIASTTKSSLEDEIKSLKNNASFHHKNHSIEPFSIQDNYELYKSKYFLFLYTAIPIGQFQSVYMKSFYLNTLYTYMYQNNYTDTPFIQQSDYQKYHRELFAFTQHYTLCNDFYQELYDGFTLAMEKYVPYINKELAQDTSLLDQYLFPISNQTEHIQSLYYKIRSIPNLLRNSVTKQFILQDLLNIKSTGFQLPNSYEQHSYKNFSLLDFINQDEKILVGLSPVNNHFLSIDEIIKKNKQLLSLSDKLTQTDSDSSHITKPSKSSSFQNLSIKIKKYDS